MVEQGRFSLPQIAKAIQEGCRELYGHKVRKRNSGIPEYDGEGYVYRKVYQAKKLAEKEGGEFWIEPLKDSSKSPEPWHPKTYDEEQVAGILDELQSMMITVGNKRIANEAYPILPPNRFYQYYRV